MNDKNKIITYFFSYMLYLDTLPDLADVSQHERSERYLFCGTCRVYSYSKVLSHFSFKGIIVKTINPSPQEAKTMVGTLKTMSPTSGLMVLL